MDKFPLTKKGFLRLEQELKTLKGVERPNVIAAIAEARSHGDLSENAEYSAAKENKALLKGGFRSWKPSSAGHKLLTRQK